MYSVSYSNSSQLLITVQNVQMLVTLCFVKTLRTGDADLRF